VSGGGEEEYWVGDVMVFEMGALVRFTHSVHVRVSTHVDTLWTGIRLSI
jgi:hypothetical protein